MSALLNMANATPKNLTESVAIILHDPSLMLVMLCGVVRRFPRRVRDSIEFFDTVEAAQGWHDQRQIEFGY